jgi:hypothetical protein
MIDEAKVKELLRDLLARSRANEIVWQNPPARPGWSTFVVQLGKSQIEVAYTSPPSEPDSLGVWVHNAEGRVIWSLVQTEGEPEWDLVYSLYEDAARCVIKWDDTLNEIRTELAKPGQVGQPELPADKEIPF